MRQEVAGLGSPGDGLLLLSVDLRRATSRELVASSSFGGSHS